MFVDKVMKAVTLVKVPTNSVLEKKETEDYAVVKLGVTEKRGKLNKAQKVELEKKDLPACKLTKEFRISKEEISIFESSVSAKLLKDFEYVDVTSKSIGKGFAGGMKRWGFSGAPETHGSSLSHRAIGSTGTREFNWPGKKMPGRLGGDVTTIQNIKVVAVDEELGLVAIYGSVPGKPGTWVELRKSIKKGANNAN